MILLLAACNGPTGPDTPAPTHPTLPTSTPTPTGATAETGTPVADTGWTTTGDLLATTLGGFVPCPDPGAAAALQVTAVDGGDVTLARSGPIHGCGAPTALRAGLDASSSTIELHWVAGDCDAVLCFIGSATIHDVPAGAWTLHEAAPGATLQAGFEI